MHAHDRTLLARLGFSDPDKTDARHVLACQYIAQKEVRQRIVETVIGPVVATIRKTDDGEGQESKTYRHYRYNRVGTVDMNSLRVETLYPAQLEVPVSKGTGQYKTTIGFIDVMFDYEYDIKWSAKIEVMSKIQVAPPVMESVYRNGRFGEWAQAFDSNGKKILGGGYGVLWEEPDCNGRQAGVREKEPAKFKDQWDPIESISGVDLEKPEWVRWTMAVEVKIAPTPVDVILRQINLYREYEASDYRGRHVWLVVTDFPLSDTDILTLKDAKIHHAQLGQSFTDWIVRQEQASIAAATTNRAASLVI